MKQRDSSRAVILGQSQPAKNRNLSRLISNLRHKKKKYPRLSPYIFTLGSRLIYCTVEDCKLIVQIHGICSSSGEDFGPLVPRFHQSALFSQSSWIFDWWCSRCTKIVLVRELSEESDQFRSDRHLSRLVSNLSRLNRSSESNSVYCFSTVFIFLQQQKVPEAKL